MKRLFKLFIFIFCQCSVLLTFAQKEKADSLRKAGDFNQAIYHYSQEELSFNIMYNLAICYASLEEQDSAFYYINLLIDYGKADIIPETFTSCSEFDSLFNDARWEKSLEKIAKYRLAYESTINTKLRDEIYAMRKIDNKYQIEYSTLMRTEKDTNKVKQFREEWTDAVNKNTMRMKEIVAEFSWPTISMVGNNASDDAFFLIQHCSDTAFQKECLILLKEAFKENNVNGFNLALLEDRLLVIAGKKQLYGSQFNSQTKEIYPIENPDSLSIRRANLKLQ